MTRAFFDSNVLIYAFTEDERATRARVLLKDGGAISVQTLNEVANVTRRKLRFDWDDVGKVLSVIRSLCRPVLPLTSALHDSGMAIARRYRLSIYDAMITAAALASGCEILWSEVMHDGLIVDERLRIVNPFTPIH